MSAPRGDKPVTHAQRMRAIAQLRRNGGVVIVAPVNILVRSHPAQTIEACREVLAVLVRAPKETRAADILHEMVQDALIHAQTTLETYGAEPKAVMP